MARISLLRPWFLGAWADRAEHVHLRAPGRGRVCLDAVACAGADAVDDGRLPDDCLLAADVLQSWGMQVSVDAVPVLLLPFPVVALSCHQQWRKLVLLTRWHPEINLEHDRRVRANRMKGPIISWPPEDSSAWANIGLSAVETEPPPMRASSLAAVAAELRRWAPAIMTAQHPDDVAGERQALEECPQPAGLERIFIGGVWMLEPAAWDCDKIPLRVAAAA